jgi:hypothetical protein
MVADANKQRSTPASQWNRELDAQAVSRATKDYLATHDDAAFGAASDVRPKFVSPSDAAAQWTEADITSFNRVMVTGTLCRCCFYSWQCGRSRSSLRFD